MRQQKVHNVLIYESYICCRDNPEKEEDFLKERSPITYVDFISPTTSLLVIQVANDPRVVKNESDQIIERLKSRNFDVEYMVFEDEGHGFTKYSNLVKA